MMLVMYIYISIFTDTLNKGGLYMRGEVSSSRSEISRRREIIHVYIKFCGLKLTFMYARSMWYS